MPTIGNAPSGADSSSDGTEKIPVSGSKFMLVSTIAEYIRTLTQTLTGKTINLTSNTLTGTTAQFNTALSDGDFATLAGTEALTNKTITVMDANLSITDDGDTSKVAKFQASGITTATTRTFTLPDVTDTIVTLTASQTLTNKTLTTPTIASFTNATHNHEAAGGGGTLDEDALALTDVTTNNSSTSKHGFLKKLDNDNTHFMDGTGAWSVPTVAGAVATDAIWDAKGDLAGGTGANTAARLAVGTNGQVLTADSAETTGMKWSTVAGTGDVVGPGSATDNAITRFDSTTGKLIQNSAATVDDNGTVNIPTGQTYNINGSAHTHSYISTDGWQSVSQTWTYASADDPVYQIYVSGDVTASADYKLGNKIKCTNNSTTVYGFIVKVGSYDGGNTRTPVDVYCGTDYDIANSAITAPYISKVKSPDGFPLSPAKWTASASDTTSRTQASPVQNTWYNLGSVTLSIPIGIWYVTYQVVARCDVTSDPRVMTTFSTANNSASDSEFTAFTGSSANVVIDHITRSKTLTLTSKTSYYLNTRTTVSGATQIQNPNDQSPLLISAVCVYL